MRRTLLACGLALGGLAWGLPSWGFSWPGEATRLEAQLSSDDAAARLGAARRLGRLTPRVARPLILRAFADPELEVRLAAVEAALTLEVSDIGGEVVPWLREREARARVAAVEVLTHDPVESAIGPLGRVLADADPRVRRGAAAALGEMGRARAQTRTVDEVRADAAAQLLGRLDDADPAVRGAVIDSLARLGDRRAVLPLVAKLQDTEVEVRIAVVRALGVVGDPRASGAVLIAARDREGAVRVQAARALSMIGDVGAIPTLVALAEDSGPVEVRRAALVALGPLCAAESPHRAAGIEALVRGLAEPSTTAAAERALTALGTAAGDALIACLGRTTGQVSAACARVLAAVRPEGAADAIRRALEQGSVSAAPALKAVGRLGSADALILALEHLTHPEPATRAAALRAVVQSLRASGGDAQAAGPLLAALQEGGWSTQQRLELIESLGWSGDPSVGPALAAAFSSTSQRVQLATLVALGRVPGHGQDALLLTALDDADASLRRAAALSLRNTGAGSVTHELLTRLESRAGQDREAVALALAGPLGASGTPSAIERARRAIPRMPPPARDSLIEAIATALPTEAGSRALAELAEGTSVGDRSKVAEVLAFHGQGRSLLVELAGDEHAAVRAHAAWSLGAHAPDASTREVLRSLLADADAAVVTNAYASVARWIARQERAQGDADAEGKHWSEALCAGLGDPRAAVRVNAIAALGQAGSSCAGHPWARLLRSDPAEEVRAAVVRVLAATLQRTDGNEQGMSAEHASAAFELRRCSAFELSRRVASSCDAALGLGEGSLESPKSRARQETLPRLVYVLGRRSGTPATRAPFLAMQWLGGDPEGGVLRGGWTDRRGAFGEAPGLPVSRLVESSLLRAGAR